MTNQLRRSALSVTLLALISSAFAARAADIPQVKVTVNDKQCEPMTLTVNAGKTQFIILNHSQKALEWRRGDHLARATPLGPEIDQHRFLGIQHCAIKVGIADMYNLVAHLGFSSWIAPGHAGGG